MEIIRTVAAMRAWRRQAGKLAFVPTMGNLHAGHLALSQGGARARRQSGGQHLRQPAAVWPGRRFRRLSAHFRRRLRQAARRRRGRLVLPEEQELYPRVRQDFNVEPPNIQNELCGAFRPGHFRGVATVVTKLFNIVQPDLACFGKKDFQQLHVIRAMVDDLNSPIEIVPVDTGRADDGLALSSRNGYLSAEERAEAPRLYRNLTRLQQRLQDGDNDYATLEQARATIWPRRAGPWITWKSARPIPGGGARRRKTPGRAGGRAPGAHSADRQHRSVPLNSGSRTQSCSAICLNPSSTGSPPRTASCIYRLLRDRREPAGSGRHSGIRRSADLERHQRRAFRHLRDQGGTRLRHYLGQWLGGAPGAPGDLLIIASFAQYEAAELKDHQPAGLRRRQ